MALVAPAGADPTVALANTLGSFADRLAVILPRDEQVSYGQLAERVRETAIRLGRERKLVLIAAANELEPLVWYLAALQAGHPAILASGDDQHEVDWLVAAYDPDVVLCRRDGVWIPLERRARSAHVLHPELALLLCTSGSTGSPKLVRLSHTNIQANAESIARYLDIRDTDRAATSLPMHYCYGLSVINSHLLRGAGLILTELSVIDRCFWDRFRAHGGTTFAGVPYTFDLLDRIGFDSMQLPTLRYVTQAGGRLGPDRVRRYAGLGRRRGWDLFVMYGQTEATARMAYLPPDRVEMHPGAIGVPIPGGSFAIEPIDDAGTDDGAGELVYRGPNVMLGYAEGPSDLAQGRTIDALHTGDIARRTSEGLYEVVGRRSRFLKLFGVRVDLEQVEHLLDSAGIDAVCTGDDRFIVVAVTSEQDAEVAHEIVTGRLRLPPSSIRICRFAEIPRLSSGKPDYVAIRERGTEVADSSAVAGLPNRGDRNEAAVPDRALHTLFATVLGAADVRDDSTFVSLGGDSLSYVELSIALEKRLGVLPANWHLTPLRELASAGRRRRVWRRIDTTVLLRAVAIVLVVGSHAKLFWLQGGAHLLLGIAGFNFARFQLSPARQERVIQMVRSVGRIAVPSMCWIGLLVILTDDYSLTNVVLVNDLIGTTQPNDRWHYWYIETLVQILLGLALILCVPAVRRFERRHAYGFAVLLVLVMFTIRFDLMTIGDGSRRLNRPQNIVWIFMIGWAAERATSVAQKLLVSGLIALSVPGFFGNSGRDAVVLVGLLLLVWVSRCVVPWPLNRAVGLVAGASLYIYLVHWQVYPPMLDRFSPLAAVVAATLVGVVLWSVGPKLIHRLVVHVRAMGPTRFVPRRTSARRREGAAPAVTT